MKVWLKNSSLAFASQSAIEYITAVKTSESNQFVDLSSLVGEVGYSVVKGEIQFVVNSDKTARTVPIFSTKNSYLTIYAYDNTLHGKVKNITDQTVTIDYDSNQFMTFDMVNKQFGLGGQTFTFEGSVATSTINPSCLFADTTGASDIGALSIKGFKMFNASSNTLLVDLLPAKDFAGVPCFYNKVSQTFVYPNTGTFVGIE